MIIPQIITPFSELKFVDRLAVLGLAYQAHDAWEALIHLSDRYGLRTQQGRTIALFEVEAIEIYICGATT